MTETYHHWLFQSMQAFSNAPSTVVFRIDPGSDGFPMPRYDEGIFAGYSVVASPEVLDSRELSALVELLANRKSFLSEEGGKACTFSPSIGLRMTRRDDQLDLLLHFECQQMRILLNGEFRAMVDFDPSYLLLLSITQRSLPAEAETQQPGQGNGSARPQGN